MQVICQSTTYTIIHCILLTNGEQVSHYHPKFEGGKVVDAVVMPPQAY